jgi:hypothetical protein
MPVLVIIVMIVAVCLAASIINLRPVEVEEEF